jgi:hypothetical protein
MATTYSFKGQVTLTCSATNSDDSSTDTSTAPLADSITKSSSSDRAIYTQVDSNGGSSLELDSLTDGLGGSGIVLISVHAICIKNLGTNAVTISGDFLGTIASGDIPTLPTDGVFYMSFPTAETVTGTSKDTLTLTSSGGANNVDVWISGSTS